MNGCFPSPGGAVRPSFGRRRARGLKFSSPQAEVPAQLLGPGPRSLSMRGGVRAPPPTLPARRRQDHGGLFGAWAGRLLWARTSRESRRAAPLEDVARRWKSHVGVVGLPCNFSLTLGGRFDD